MSEGAKTALVLGGAAAVGYFLFFRSAAASVPLTPAPTASPPLAPAPGAPISTGITTAVKLGASTIAGVSTAAISGVTKIGSTFYSVDKQVLGGAYSAAKSADKAVIGGVSSAVHSVLSIF